jgi:hypothetical protein
MNSDSIFMISFCSPEVEAEAAERDRDRERETEREESKEGRETER